MTRFERRVAAVLPEGVPATWEMLRARGLTPPASEAHHYRDCLGQVRRSDNGEPVEVRDVAA